MAWLKTIPFFQRKRASGAVWQLWHVVEIDKDKRAKVRPILVRPTWGGASCVGISRPGLLGRIIKGM